MSLEHVRVVLVRPKTSGNVGATARAAANFGVGDLALVAPRGYRAAAAAKTAVHAGLLLERRRKFATLAEAIADCAWVVGTTCRGGSYRRRMRTPRDIAPEVVAVARTRRVALVFGPEDHGLSNEELKLCHELVTIPTHSSYPSLNLSHAALVCLYELFVVRHATRAPMPALATSAALERMYGDLGRALLAIGFLHGANPGHIMMTIRRVFGRARLDERELAIWLGVARQIDWFATGGREIADEKQRRGERLK
jgi:tRNA/rRNA methyltransferase